MSIEPPKNLFLNLSLCIALFSFGGCGKGDAESARLLPTKQTTANPSVHGVSLSIDDASVLFPEGELRAQATGNGVAVQWSTPSADAANGNSFNFDFTLEDIDDPANLAGAAWHFSNDDPERSETLNGLTLKGGAAVLEPIEIHILFAAEAGGKLTIELEGQFRWFEPPDAETPVKIVTVWGKFTVPMPE